MKIFPRKEEFELAEKKHERSLCFVTQGRPRPRHINKRRCAAVFSIYIFEEDKIQQEIINYFIYIDIHIHDNKSFF